VVSIRRSATPPVFTPAGYGLLSVAEPAGDDTDSHWRNGVEYQPQYCGTALDTTAVCVTGGVPKPALPGGIGINGADPFAVYAWLDCSPVGYSPDEWRRITTAALANNEAAALENVFWTGAVDGGTVYPHLAADTAVTEGTAGFGQVVSLQTAASVVVTGTGVDVVEAVGLLEGAMGGCYGGTPVLHVPRRALAHLASWNLVQRDGPRLRTPAGSLVAAGLGYPGTAPDGSTPDAGTAWFYATGAVKVWRSAIELTGTNPADWIGRPRNDQVLVAERTYVVGWDCCHFAVPVRLGGAVTGTVGTPT
jgi:hypothetical protein